MPIYREFRKKGVLSHTSKNWNVVSILILTSQELTASQNTPGFPESHENINWWAT